MDVVMALTAHIATTEIMTNTHFSNVALGQLPTQVDAVQQPRSWCEICGGSDHRANVCGENKYFVNFLGNA